MQIYKKTSLKPFHTFSVDISCEILVIVESIEELISVYQNSEWALLPKLMLGKGSNLLFTEHFNGVVVVNRILGKTITESETEWNLHVSGGEDWPELVEWTVNQDLPGLENLALIPGCAGSAPIQNIGAYGIEFKDVCQYVDVLSLDDFTVRRLSAEECQFGYRDSVFKHALYEKVIIIAVGIRLNKSWQPVVSYGSLSDISSDELSSKRIYDEVCQVRMSKLPDPAEVGNAGSFFKNPVVSMQEHQRLHHQYPKVVAYPFGDKMKLAAGWLIDQCGLKGYQLGGARVHSNQALVIINQSDATANDVLRLAAHVRDTVYKKYGVLLEHEVRFMGARLETSLNKLIESDYQ